MSVPYDLSFCSSSVAPVPPPSVSDDVSLLQLAFRSTTLVSAPTSFRRHSFSIHCLLVLVVFCLCHNAFPPFRRPARRAAAGCSRLGLSGCSRRELTGCYRPSNHHCSRREMSPDCQSQFDQWFGQHGRLSCGSHWHDDDICDAICRARLVSD